MTTDRYVSFEGIDCDDNARRIMEYLGSHLAGGVAASPWARYFAMKLEQRIALGQDDLFFVGSQLNDLRSFFAEVRDEAALALLDQVEEECC